MTDRCSPMWIARWAGTLGVITPGIGAAFYPVWLFPATQTSGSDLVRWAANNHDRLVISQTFYTIGVGLWLVFGAAVWSHLRAALPKDSFLTTGFAAGLIAFVTLREPRLACGERPPVVARPGARRSAD